MTALSTGAAFAALFDDAATFPPGNLPMHTAVRQHVGFRCSDRAALVGPFVCSVARLPELDAALRELGQRIDVSIVVPASAAELVTTERMSVVSIEKPPGARTPSVGITYVELPTLPTRADQLADLGGARAKFRTGGVTADAYPSEAALAMAIGAAVEAGVAFKCTAGLHNAVRHTSSEGFEHHGFLNVLLATHAAQHGDDVVAALAERDGATVAAAFRALPDDESLHVRELFCSFGTCSITEPIADLQQLGLLD